MNDLSKVSIKRIEGLHEELAGLYDKIEEAAKTGVAYSVGQVFWSQSNLREENVGGLPLFTGEDVAVADYDALHRFLLRNSSVVKTKAEYDAIIADTSVDCPYYAIENGRIYLPLFRRCLELVHVTPAVDIPEHTEEVTTNFYGWTSSTNALYAWTHQSGTVYTSSQIPSVGDPVLDANGNQVSWGTASSAPATVTSYDAVNNTMTANANGAGWAMGVVYPYGFPPWTFSRNSASDTGIITIYTKSTTPAVADPVYSSPVAAATATGSIDNLGTNTITATVSGAQATYTRNQSVDTSITETVVIPAYHEDQVVESTNVNLYPWVSYVTSVHDISTPIEYAKADLSNVTNIAAASPVQPKLTAGTNVTITNNTISATDTTYTAGTGISISNGVIACTVSPTPATTWGSITGTIANQTDLTNYIKQLIGASGMLGRMNFNGGVAFTLHNNGVSASATTYTCPSDGYIIVSGSSTNDRIVLGGKSIGCYNNGYGVPLVLPVSEGDVVGYSGGTNSSLVSGVFYPQK